MGLKEESLSKGQKRALGEEVDEDSSKQQQKCKKLRLLSIGYAFYGAVAFVKKIPEVFSFDKVGKTIGKYFRFLAGQKIGEINQETHDKSSIEQSNIRSHEVNIESNENHHDEVNFEICDKTIEKKNNRVNLKDGDESIKELSYIGSNEESDKVIEALNGEISQKTNESDVIWNDKEIDERYKEQSEIAVNAESTEVLQETTEEFNNDQLIEVFQKDVIWENKEINESNNEQSGIEVNVKTSNVIQETNEESNLDQSSNVLQNESYQRKEDITWVNQEMDELNREPNYEMCQETNTQFMAMHNTLQFVENVEFDEKYIRARCYCSFRKLAAKIFWRFAVNYNGSISDSPIVQIMYRTFHVALMLKTAKKKLNFPIYMSFEGCNNDLNNRRNLAIVPKTTNQKLNFPNLSSFEENYNDEISEDDYPVSDESEENLCNKNIALVSKRKRMQVSASNLQPSKVKKYTNSYLEEKFLKFEFENKSEETKFKFHEQAREIVSTHTMVTRSSNRYLSCEIEARIALNFETKYLNVYKGNQFRYNEDDRLERPLHININSIKITYVEAINFHRIVGSMYGFTIEKTLQLYANFKNNCMEAYLNVFWYANSIRDISSLISHEITTELTWQYQYTVNDVSLALQDYAPTSIRVEHVLKMKHAEEELSWIDIMSISGEDSELFRTILHFSRLIELVENSKPVIFDSLSFIRLIKYWDELNTLGLLDELPFSVTLEKHLGVEHEFSSEQFFDYEEALRMIKHDCEQKVRQYTERYKSYTNRYYLATKRPEHFTDTKNMVLTVNKFTILEVILLYVCLQNFGKNFYRASYILRRKSTVIIKNFYEKHIELFTTLIHFNDDYKRLCYIVDYFEKNIIGLQVKTRLSVNYTDYSSNNSDECYFNEKNYVGKKMNQEDLKEKLSQESGKKIKPKVKSIKFNISGFMDEDDLFDESDILNYDDEEFYRLVEESEKNKDKTVFDGDFICLKPSSFLEDDIWENNEEEITYKNEDEIIYDEDWLIYDEKEIFDTKKETVDDNKKTFGIKEEMFDFKEKTMDDEEWIVYDEKATFGMKTETINAEEETNEDEEATSNDEKPMFDDVSQFAAIELPQKILLDEKTKRVLVKDNPLLFLDVYEYNQVLESFADEIFKLHKMKNEDTKKSTQDCDSNSSDIKKEFESCDRKLDEKTSFKDENEVYQKLIDLHNNKDTIKDFDKEKNKLIKKIVSRFEVMENLDKPKVNDEVEILFDSENNFSETENTFISCEETNFCFGKGHLDTILSKYRSKIEENNIEDESNFRKLSIQDLPVQKPISSLEENYETDDDNNEETNDENHTFLKYYYELIENFFDFTSQIEKEFELLDSDEYSNEDSDEYSDEEQDTIHTMNLKDEESLQLSPHLLNSGIEIIQSNNQIKKTPFETENNITKIEILHSVDSDNVNQKLPVPGKKEDSILKNEIEVIELSILDKNSNHKNEKMETVDDQESCNSSNDCEKDLEIDRIETTDSHQSLKECDSMTNNFNKNSKENISKDVIEISDSDISLTGNNQKVKRSTEISKTNIEPDEKSDSNESSYSSTDFFKPYYFGNKKLKFLNSSEYKFKIFDICKNKRLHLKTFSRYSKSRIKLPNRKRSYLRKLLKSKFPFKRNSLLKLTKSNTSKKVKSMSENIKTIDEAERRKWRVDIFDCEEIQDRFIDEFEMVVESSKQSCKKGNKNRKVTNMYNHLSDDELKEITGELKFIDSFCSKLFSNWNSANSSSEKTQNSCLLIPKSIEIASRNLSFKETCEKEVKDYPHEINASKYTSSEHFILPSQVLNDINYYSPEFLKKFYDNIDFTKICSDLNTFTPIETEKIDLLPHKYFDFDANEFDFKPEDFDEVDWSLFKPEKFDVNRINELEKFEIHDTELDDFEESKLDEFDPNEIKFDFNFEKLIDGYDESMDKFKSDSIIFENFYFDDLFKNTHLEPEEMNFNKSDCEESNINPFSWKNITNIISECLPLNRFEYYSNDDVNNWINSKKRKFIELELDDCDSNEDELQQFFVEERDLKKIKLLECVSNESDWEEIEPLMIELEENDREKTESQESDLKEIHESVWNESDWGEIGPLVIDLEESDSGETESQESSSKKNDSELIEPLIIDLEESDLDEIESHESASSEIDSEESEFEDRGMKKGDFGLCPCFKSEENEEKLNKSLITIDIDFKKTIHSILYDTKFLNFSDSNFEQTSEDRESDTNSLDSNIDQMSPNRSSNTCLSKSNPLGSNQDQESDSGSLDEEKENNLDPSSLDLLKMIRNVILDEVRDDSNGELTIELWKMVKSLETVHYPPDMDSCLPPSLSPKLTQSIFDADFLNEDLNHLYNNNNNNNNFKRKISNTTSDDLELKIDHMNLNKNKLPFLQAEKFNSAFLQVEMSVFEKLNSKSLNPQNSVTESNTFLKQDKLFSSKPNSNDSMKLNPPSVSMLINSSRSNTSSYIREVYPEVVQEESTLDNDQQEIVYGNKKMKTVKKKNKEIKRKSIRQRNLIRSKTRAPLSNSKFLCDSKSPLALNTTLSKSYSSRSSLSKSSKSKSDTPSSDSNAPVWSDSCKPSHSVSNKSNISSSLSKSKSYSVKHHDSSIGKPKKPFTSSEESLQVSTVKKQARKAFLNAEEKVKQWTSSSRSKTNNKD